jgi:hypothetical protein
MTDPIDQLLAAVLSRASEKTAEEQQHGRLVGKGGGWRTYQAFRDGCGVLTLVARSGQIVRYEVVGVDLEALR